nr:brain tumor protein [Onthophagus taurus]
MPILDMHRARSRLTWLERSDKLLLPRVLSCLHVFCEHCLDKKLIGESGDAGSAETVITCPTCNQDTKVGTKKLASLPLDVMTTNISDVSNSINLQCTSCTAKEVAISRCCTCHNLLCGNCETAHRYMRCFSSHKVISLEELRKDGQKITIHKPLVCDIHAGENVIYYCSTCNVPACTECAKLDHKVAAGHQCESISDSEIRVRQELEGMVAEVKVKIDQTTKVSGDLESSLIELANQRSTAKDLINESYQSYKAVLEKCRDTALDELNTLYRERELKVMDMTEKVGKEIGMLEDACKFASRLLDNGTVAEIMYLRKTVGTQLLNLVNNTLKPEKKFCIEFQPDFIEFESCAKTLFGKFQTESTSPSSTLSKPKDSSPVTVGTTTLPPLNINGCAGGSSLSNSSPISLPTSMQSSFDGDLGANLQGLTIAAQSPPVTQINAAPLQGFSRIAEYNIAQLATLADANAAAAAAASAATSPTQFTLADLFNTDTAYKNLHSLAKLGLNSSENTLSNGGQMLRPNSPATLNITNTLLNGFNPVSSSTSPLLSTPDDILPDPLTSIVSNPNGGASQVIQRTNKVSPMQIRCKFGQLGPSKGQFNSPHGFCLGTEEDIVVADTNNHRIQIFEKTGTFKFQFGIAGKDEGQLWYPRKVAVMRSSGKYVVCDRGNERSRMQIFTKNGHFLKKIAIRYIDIVAGLAVTTMGEIVAVDSVSPTVFVISENGELLRWFDCSDYMREPSDIAIHGKEFYVCDFKGHNVVVFSEDGTFLRRIGWENVTSYPNGIDISDAGDVLIGDSHGNRFHVAVFSREGPLISEFECPYVKVSRCCGLKITSEGYVVTLAKNNHHVLVLNTLYIL